MSSPDPRHQPRSVLVTGAAGFIGSGLVRALLRDPDVRVVSVDALTYAGSREHLRGLDAARHQLVEANVSERVRMAELIAGEAIDTVIHLAAETHVDRSIDDVEPFLATNVAASVELLRAARAAWRGRTGVLFHQVSTDEVYGPIATGEVAGEDAPIRPHNPYAATKAAQQHLALAWRATYGLPVSVSLPTNCYGPRQFPEKLLPLAIDKALRGQVIPIYGDGRQQRSWLYVDDACAGILAAVTRGEPGRCYNLGGGEPRENREVVALLCRALDRQRPAGAPHERLITHVGDRPGHDRRYALDSARADRELGWSAATALERGLEQTVRWYLDHCAWADEVRARYRGERLGTGVD